MLPLRAEHRRSWSDGEEDLATSLPISAANAAPLPAEPEEMSNTQMALSLQMEI